MTGSRLVLGIGNRDRGDDAVGPIVCDRLRERIGSAPVRSVVCEGPIIDLALHWDADDRVVIVDAIAPGDEPGRIVTLDVSGDAVPSTSMPVAVSTHEVDVSVAIGLARVLGRMPSQLVLIGVEAEQVAWGSPLSAPVAAAVGEVVDRLVELLDEPFPRRA